MVASGSEAHKCAVGLVGGLHPAVAYDFRTLVVDGMGHAVAPALYVKIRRERIYRLDADSIQTHRLFKRL